MEEALQVSGTEQTAESVETIDRPDNIPDKFWDSETNSAKVDSMAEAYTALEKKMFTKNEVLRAELADERLASRPEDLSKYTTPELEGVEWSDTDQLLSFWREQSFTMGLDNEQFQSGVSAYIDAVQKNAPNIEAEMAKLGDDAQTRVNAVKSWSEKLSTQTQEQLAKVANSAEGLMAVEELMGMVGKSGGLVDSQASAPVKRTIEELQQLMNSPKYWDPAHRDPKLIEEITQGFARL
jgi:hypothetical protein